MAEEAIVRMLSSSDAKRTGDRLANTPSPFAHVWHHQRAADSLAVKWLAAPPQHVARTRPLAPGLVGREPGAGAALRTSAHVLTRSPCTFAS